jgi:CubicO group peptidase (beta-lactamase class C family)
MRLRLMLYAITLLAAQSVNADQQPLAGLADAIAHGDFPKTTSVLVMQRDRIIYERYFGDGGAEVFNDTRSATKSITALAIGAAIQDRSISSVNSPAFQYLADLAPFENDSPLKREITIEDFLTMSVGAGLRRQCGCKSRQRG